MRFGLLSAGLASAWLVGCGARSGLLASGEPNGGSGSTGYGGSDGGVQTNRFSCVDPRPIVVAGKDTGYDTCQGGFIQRRKVAECPDLLPGPDFCATCSDATCGKVKPYGHCDLGTGNVCQCMPGCRTDADCGPGSICFCGALIGTCVKSNCTSDASCGGKLCTDYVTATDPCGTGFACQTVNDECRSALDCPPGDECGYDGMRHACRGIVCLQ